MIKYLLLLIPVIFLACQGSSEKSKLPEIQSGSIQPMPDQWIDADTKHRIFRIGRDSAENRSFYFHNNPFIPGKGDDGDLMVYYSKVDGNNQLFVVNLKTLKSEQLTNHNHRIRGEIVNPKLREAFYQSRDSVFAVNVDTKENRLVYVFPEDFKAGISAVNSTGELMAGSWSAPIKDSIYRADPRKSSYFESIYEAKIPHTVFTVNINTGILNKIHSDTAWINHIQFSPIDPKLLMFAHEGPWHKVDRIWTVDVTNPNPKLMHQREVYREIAGHEFFSKDGKTIWYDLQKPREVNFFLAGVNIETGKKTMYELQSDQWSIHFNISPDQQSFAGDGGDSTQVAHAKNGRWIYHHVPKDDTLISEKLVNMSTHNYRPLEPNVHFSPDGKWVIFRSDMDGKSEIYGVEL